MTTDQQLLLDALCRDLAKLAADNAAHLIANAEARLVGAEAEQPPDLQ